MPDVGNTRDERAADELAGARGRWWPGAETTPDGVAEPQHYALINGVYLVALAGVAAMAQARHRGGQQAIPAVELPVLGIASFALADVLAKQKVATWLREPFVEESEEHRPVSPEGAGFRYAIGELLTCTRCVGAWCALGLVGLRVGAPATGRSVSAVLATAGVNHFLQAGFRLLCEKGNKVAAKACATEA